ncbi:class I adenylate-forming enzyme family protein [Alkalihalobacillus sp. BA299]|uniref:class I adenylate-forming enzyme family protein n=1 Tax=Alkalihalobacillus sp. BA299 TaxID=2815938 RepID=UPI001ADCBDC1|nr:class I adenylate-forming enzyme family protein [Alkalihalobacillus sp. BA299]
MNHWTQKSNDQFEITYDEEGIPLYKYRPKNVYQLLKNTALRIPQSSALIFNEETLTYSDLLQRVNRVAYHLSRHYGVKPGDRIALLLENGIDYPTCFFAIAQIGAISVPLNTRLAGEEIIHEINNSESTILIADHNQWLKVKDLLTNMPTLKHCFVTDQKPQHSSAEPFDFLLFPHDDQEIVHPAKETDICSIFFTSGTTGKPKGATLTHLGFISTGMNFANTFSLETDDRTLMIVPMLHITGMLQFLGAIYTGIPIYIIRAFKTEKVIEMVKTYKPSILVGVPTMFWFILSSPNFCKEDFKSVRSILYGGAPAPVDLIKNLRKDMPQTKIHNGYGLTEGHGLDTLLPDHDALVKPESIGLPVPLVQVKVIDSQGNELQANQVGELIIKGAKVIPGYWKNPEATQHAIKDGWLYTGDLAKIDEEGYVYIVDRKKDMINRGGEKIFSIEVENLLYSHSKILEAAVVGIPDNYLGQQVKAYIVLKPGEVCSELEIKEFCFGKIADFKVPKFIEFLKELPRNAGGKVLKKVLSGVSL